MRDDALDVVIRVLVADDTRLHTQLLSDALRRVGSLEVVGSDSQELVQRADLRNIDVLLLSFSLDERPAGGLEVLREVRASHPNIRAVVLLDSSKPASVLGAFRAGARGVLSRHESIEILSKCVKRVHQGQIWANSEQLDVIVQALASSHCNFATNAQGMEHLSKREVEIVRCVSQGLTNREIASQLELSQHTVKNYLFRVFDKLGVSSRVELLTMALNRTIQPDSVASGVWRGQMNNDLLSESSLIGCQRAAEQGVTAAQLDLARYYWARKSDAKDLIQAYKWYLIASQQISRTGRSVGRSLTMEQVLQAEQMAAEWNKKSQKNSPASIRDSGSRLASPILRAASE